ncbi:hypothetical protein ACM66B_004620 [Microbotryomycetes sp. NB124-2]
MPPRRSSRRTSTRGSTTATPEDTVNEQVLAAADEPSRDVAPPSDTAEAATQPVAPSKKAPNANKRATKAAPRRQKAARIKSSSDGEADDDVSAVARASAAVIAPALAAPATASSELTVKLSNGLPTFKRPAPAPESADEAPVPVQFQTNPDSLPALPPPTFKETGWSKPQEEPRPTPVVAQPDLDTAKLTVEALADPAALSPLSEPPSMVKLSPLRKLPPSPLPPPPKSTTPLSKPDSLAPPSRNTDAVGPSAAAAAPITRTSSDANTKSVDDAKPKSASAAPSTSAAALAPAVATSPAVTTAPAASVSAVAATTNAAPVSTTSTTPAKAAQPPAKRPRPSLFMGKKHAERTSTPAPAGSASKAGTSASFASASRVTPAAKRAETKSASGAIDATSFLANLAATKSATPAKSGSASRSSTPVPKRTATTKSSTPLLSFAERQKQEEKEFQEHVARLREQQRLELEAMDRNKIDLLEQSRIMEKFEAPFREEVRRRVTESVQDPNGQRLPRMNHFGSVFSLFPRKRRNEF